MARRALAASFVIAPFAAALAMQGCTQDFSTFDPTGAGGGAPSTTSSTPASSGVTTSSTVTTTVGPGGGEGGAPSGPGGGGFGGSPPPDCENAADCQDDNACTDDSCGADGTCVNAAVADGQLDGDILTDCVDFFCEAGVVVEVDDDTEDPADDAATPCIATICEGGEPTPDNRPAGDSCGPSLECDGNGSCVGCDGNPADECGDPTLCSAPACNVAGGGTCEPNFLPSSTPLTDQASGDCQEPQCTGDAALPASVADNTDVPNDLPCSDRGCNAGAPTMPIRAEGMACLAGASGVCDGAGTDAAACRDCRNTAVGLGVDAGCGGGDPDLCDATANGGEGVCRDCVDDVAAGGQDTGCDAGDPICDETANGGDGACVPCADGGAGTDPGCLAGEPVCDTGNDVCVTCLDAGDGVLDDGCTEPTNACNEGAGASGTCVECTGASDCTGHPDGDDCNSNACDCDNQNDCTTSLQGRACRGSACGCNGNGDCAGITGQTGCSNNVCMCGANPCAG